MLQTIVFPLYFKLYLVQKGDCVLFFIYNNIIWNVHFNSKMIRVNRNLNSLQILHYNKRYNIHNSINHFFFLWDNFFTIKIKISGKGFKIKLIGSRIRLMLNYSNLMIYQYKKIRCNKLEKHKYVFTLKNKLDIARLYNLLNLRFVNPYTKRGIKIFSTKFFTKRGKITST